MVHQHDDIFKRFFTLITFLPIPSLLVIGAFYLRVDAMNCISYTVKAGWHVINLQRRCLLSRNHQILNGRRQPAF